MRRSDREVRGKKEIEAIIAGAEVCRIALADGGVPYLVPVCFGYRGERLYFHSAPQGRKLDMIRKNNRVCFEMETGCAVLKTGEPCRWGMAYSSVVGFGRAFILAGGEEKIEALDIIMAHYGGDRGGYSPQALDTVTVVKIEIESMTAKRGRPAVRKGS